MEQDIGSTEGLYVDANLSIAERATRLVTDVLGIVHSELLEAAFAEENGVLIDTLDAMLDHFREVVVVDQVEHEDIHSDHSMQTSGIDGAVGISTSARPFFALADKRTSEVAHEDSSRTRSTGARRQRVHFGGVTQLMRRAVALDNAERLWLLFDEWSGIPIELQPYLAEMLRRLFFGLPQVTVRIAAIPHRSQWRIAGERGDYIGAEVGAELFPLLDLDEFVVFPARNREEQARRSLSFFRELLFRHISTAVVSRGEDPPASEDELIGSLFTQITSLKEIIRAAEGVPRDALNITGHAGLRAVGSKIGVAHVRQAAEQLYTTTKAVHLNGVPRARELLDIIFRDVISDRKARAFLIRQDQAQDYLIQQLVDERILHIVKRGWSSKDSPGERYDVLQIDYGCYVHLLGTNAAPQGFLSSSEDNYSIVMGDVVVPEEDYRAIRRAILDLPHILKQI